MNTLNNLAIACSVMSIVVTIISIIIHVSIPKLLKHPGEFILIQCFAQLILDVH